MDSSPLSSPLHGSRRKGRFSCRRLDKLCCLAASYFPLLFVYGLTTWAVYTEAYSICWQRIGGGLGAVCGILGVLLYSMAIWTYTYAVFTPPGSPFDNKNAYSHLPTTESSLASQVTVKADGQERFCKRCQCRKPDRTHHCSSCKVCVLKMDHHCPWLANCLGLHNYKAFLLFLIYTSIFCILCFFVSAGFVYTQIFNTFNDEENAAPTGLAEDFTPVNWILLAVISGIIGLVLGGFTIWHLILTGSNMTTIESLEKVRYTAPSLRSGAPPPGAHLYGDDQPYNPGHQHHREINRYSNYLVEESSKHLPHAFNLGRKKNFAQVFGGRDKMLYWGLPMYSGKGDGWTWETSDAWRHSIEAIRAQKDQWLREQERRERAAGWGYDPAEEAAWNRANPNGLVQQASGPRPSKAERVLGRVPGSYTDTDSVPLRTLKKPLGPLDEISDDEDLDEEQVEAPKKVSPGEAEWGSWDD